MKALIVALTLALFVSGSLALAYPPKAGQHVLVNYMCSTDAGGRLLKVIHDEAQAKKRYKRFMAKGDCKGFTAFPLPIVSVLASKKDWDGDLIHMVDIGGGYVTFVYDNKKPDPKKAA